MLLIIDFIPMIFKTNIGKIFSQKESIHLKVSLSAADANSENKWKGFYNSLSKPEFECEWNEYWKN